MDLNPCNLGHLATVMILVGKRVLLKKTFRRDAPQAFGQLLMKARFTIYLENVASLNVVQQPPSCRSLWACYRAAVNAKKLYKWWLEYISKTNAEFVSNRGKEERRENGKTNRKRNLPCRNSRSNIWLFFKWSEPLRDIDVKNSHQCIENVK